MASPLPSGHSRIAVKYSTVTQKAFFPYREVDAPLEAEVCLSQWKLLKTVSWIFLRCFHIEQAA